MYMWRGSGYNPILTTGKETEWRGEEKAQGERHFQSSCCIKIGRPQEERGGMRRELGAQDASKEKKKNLEKAARDERPSRTSSEWRRGLNQVLLSRESLVKRIHLLKRTLNGRRNTSRDSKKERKWLLFSLQWKLRVFSFAISVFEHWVNTVRF